jgi:hypothetical protein
MITIDSHENLKIYYKTLSDQYLNCKQWAITKIVYRNNIPYESLLWLFLYRLCALKFDHFSEVSGKRFIHA